MPKQTVGEFIIKLAADASGLGITLDSSGKKVDIFVKNAEKKVKGLGGAFNRISSFGEKAFFTIQGFGALFRGFDSLTAAADKADASTRKFAATAKITGASLQEMRGIASKAQKDFQLTGVQANEFTIALSKLAGKAGEMEKTGGAIEGLLDVAAAKGLDAEGALVAINQAILGIDEGTDKLFGKNPSAIYIEYAKSIGTTAGKLTDQQKAQAILNETIQTGALVQGEYNKFLESDAGKKSIAAAKTEEMKAKLGQLINQVMVPLLQIATPILEMFSGMSSAMQRIVIVLGALTIATFKLIPALTALNIGLGPIGLAFLAIGAIGAVVANGIGETKAEASKLKQEMIDNSPAMRGYAQGLEGVSSELTELQKHLNGLNSTEIGKKLAPEVESLQEKFEQLDVLGSALEKVAKDKKQLEADLKTVQEAKNKNFIGSITEEKRVKTKNIKAINTEITFTEAVTNLRAMSQQLKENANDGDKVKAIFAAMEGQLKKIGEIRSKQQIAGEGLWFGGEDDLDFGIEQEVLDSYLDFGMMIGDASRQAQIVAKMQAEFNAKQKKEQAGQIDRQLQLLEAEKAKAKLIGDSIKRTEKEFAIARESINLQLEKARLFGKADEISKLETELKVLSKKLSVEKQLLKIKQQQALKKATEGFNQDAVNLELQLEEQRRAAAAETEAEKLKVQQEFAIRRINLEEQAALEKLQIDFAGLAKESEFITAREQLLENFETRRQLANQRSNEAIEKQYAELADFIKKTEADIAQEQINIREQDEIGAVLADRTLSVEQQQLAEIGIRQKYALERLKMEESTAQAELAIRFAGLNNDAALMNAKLAIEQQFQQRQQQLVQDSESQISQITVASAQNTIDVTNALFSTIQSGWDAMVNNIANNPNGKAMEGVWHSLRATAIKSIADILQADIAAAIKSATVHQAAEGSKTASVTAGVAARLGATIAGLAKETAMVLKSVGVYLAQAAAKLFSWFASKGPIGIALGIAAVPALIAGVKGIVKGVGKFEKGGIATDPTLALFAEAGAAEAAIPLDERGATFMAKLLPKIVINNPAGTGDASSSPVTEIVNVFNNIKNNSAQFLEKSRQIFKDTRTENRESVVTNLLTKVVAQQQAAAGDASVSPVTEIVNVFNSIKNNSSQFFNQIAESFTPPSFAAAGGLPTIPVRDLINANQPSVDFARTIVQQQASAQSVDLTPLMKKIDELAVVVKNSAPVINAEFDWMRFYRETFRQFEKNEKERSL